MVVVWKPKTTSHHGLFVGEEEFGGGGVSGVPDLDDETSDHSEDHFLFDPDNVADRRQQQAKTTSSSSSLVDLHWRKFGEDPSNVLFQLAKLIFSMVFMESAFLGRMAGMKMMNSNSTRTTAAGTTTAGATAEKDETITTNTIEDVPDITISEYY